MTVPLAAAGVASELLRRLGAVLAALERVAEAARHLGLPAGLALVAAGLFLAVLADRFRRGSAVTCGALVGGLAGLAAQARLAAHLGLESWSAAALGALAVAAAAAVLPAAFPAASGALCGALLGVLVPVAGRAAFGAALAALVGALVALVFARGVAALVAALAGGLAVTLGALALAGARPLADDVASRPAVVLAVALVLGIAGAAYQLERPDGWGKGAPAPPPPEM